MTIDPALKTAIARALCDAEWGEGQFDSDGTTDSERCAYEVLAAAAIIAYRKHPLPHVDWHNMVSRGERVLADTYPQWCPHGMIAAQYYFGKALRVSLHGVVFKNADNEEIIG